jgi:hypothetical protein
MSFLTVDYWKKIFVIVDHFSMTSYEKKKDLKTIIIMPFVYLIKNILDNYLLLIYRKNSHI